LTVTLSAPPPVPKNDTCAMPETLVFDNNGHATASGDLRSANNDSMSANCGGDMGADAVYTFTINATQTLNATATADMSTPNFSPILYVRKTCADDASEVNCDFGGVKAANLAPGTYFLWVDTDGTTTGKYALTVDLVTPPMNDTCNSPTAITLVNNMATVSFDTTNAADETTGTCDAFDIGPDVVYSLTLNATQQVAATIVPDQGSPNYQPVLYVRNACADDTAPAELDCNLASAVAMNAKVLMPNLPKGTYYLWVDGANGSVGKGTLSVVVSAPAATPSNENCGMPKPIAKGAMVMDDTTNAANDMGNMLSMACDSNQTGNYPGRDLAFIYTPQANGMVTVTLKAMWDPALWAIPMMCMADGSTCDMSSDNFGDGVDETLMLNAMQGVPYYLVVDSWDPGVYGAFTLSIQ
jgi:hypothetical protein